MLPNIPETNFNVARLIWKQVTCIFDMQLAEKRLRDTIKYADIYTRVGGTGVKIKLHL